jgi:hypothetical protein
MGSNLMQRLPIAVSMCLAVAVGMTAAACGNGTGTSTSSTSPAPSAPAMTSGVTVPPTATARPTVTGPAPSAVDGTSFYFRTTGTQTQVYSMTKGKVTAHYRISTDSSDLCVGNSVIVSPDGRHLAWIVGTSGTGRLTIATLDGASPRTLDNVMCLLDDRQWSSDSQTLSVSVDRGDLRQPTNINAVTGAVEPTAVRDGTMWSANRAFQAKRAGDHATFTVSTAAGSPVRTITNYTNDDGGIQRCGFLLRGLSNDGRYVAIGPCSTDPSRNLGANYLFDTVTGKHVKLPLTGVDHIRFLPGDTVLVHGGAAGARAFVLMSATGTVIARLSEPAELNDATFLSYTPA